MVKTTNFETLNFAILDAGPFQLAEMARAAVLQYAPLYRQFCEENIAISKDPQDFRRKLDFYNKILNQIINLDPVERDKFGNRLEDKLLWDIDVDTDIHETIGAFEAGLVLIWANRNDRESNLKTLQSALNFGANQNFEKLFPSQLSSVEQDIYLLEFHPEVFSFFCHYFDFLEDQMPSDQMLEVAAIKNFAELDKLTIRAM